MKLLNGDCLELMKDMEDNSVDLIITDPPYNIDVHNGSYSGCLSEYYADQLRNGLKDISAGYDIRTYNSEFVRVLNKCSIYIFMSKAQLPEYLDFYVRELGWKYDFLFWIKNDAMPSYQNKYMNDLELCVWFHKKLKAWRPANYDDGRSWYMSASISYKKHGHPTTKPLSFIQRMIRNSSKEGDIVFDPFMGSGTTGVACELLGRDFIGMEINKDYFKVAEKRIAYTVKRNKQRLF